MLNHFGLFLTMLDNFGFFHSRNITLEKYNFFEVKKYVFNLMMAPLES